MQEERQKTTCVEQSGKTLHWGSLWCSSASSFKCAYSHCQGTDMFLLVVWCYHVSLRQQNAIVAFPKNHKCTPLQRQLNIPLNDDALHKVRPLVNIAKVRLRAFIRVCSELALDEASVASRSSYGRALIFFDPLKNCGNFRFRFYLLCCATTYACVRMKVATKNNSDSPDPHNSMATIYNMSLLSKLNKLVMEMCKPLFGSKRTVNMDNFYTSPAVLILLLHQKGFSPGTFRKNHHMVPECIIYTKTEAEKAGRGTLKWAVNLLTGIYAFGWSDGNPVHMLSTADGSDQVTTVSRQNGKDKRGVPAPKTVKAHNAYIQGVDSHDQMQATFALTKRHGFKKWYIKMWLALIEIALTNARIC
jgi:hypothetical protein